MIPLSGPSVSSLLPELEVVLPVVNLNFHENCYGRQVHYFTP
jgi:hypothetical protein